MVSTINPTMIATVITFASIISLGLIATFILLLLLTQAEVIVPSASPRVRALRIVLRIAITPLLIAFVLTAVIRVVNMLSQ